MSSDIGLVSCPPLTVTEKVWEMFFFDVELLGGLDEEILTEMLNWLRNYRQKLVSRYDNADRSVDLRSLDLIDERIPR